LASEAIPGPEFFEGRTKIAIMTIDEPQARGTRMSKQVSGRRLTGAEHFRKCPLFGGYFDMRDRVWLEDHQGPLPHPACDGGP
jgi:hypothetical protein